EHAKSQAESHELGQRPRWYEGSLAQIRQQLSTLEVFEGAVLAAAVAERSQMTCRVSGGSPQ
ncbi:hypothetical protein ABTD44_20110, partial [Acinetobacter baumannii]